MRPQSGLDMDQGGFGQNGCNGCLIGGTGIALDNYQARAQER